MNGKVQHKSVDTANLRGLAVPPIGDRSVLPACSNFKLKKVMFDLSAADSQEKTSRKDHQIAA
jgi:hypothetical protein